MPSQSQENQRVVVIGAAGFGRETLDVLEAMQTQGTSLEIIGVVDDNPSVCNLKRLAEREIQYLGKLDQFITRSPNDYHYLLAIGNPKIRFRLVSKLEDAGFKAFTAIHPTAAIGSRCDISPGSIICAGAVVSTNVKLGKHVHVNPNATIGHDSILEDFVSINPSSVISGEVHIGTQTLIGANAIVLQELSIGEKCLVGASSCVTRPLPSGVLAKGLPASFRRMGE